MKGWPTQSTLADQGPPVAITVARTGPMANGNTKFTDPTKAIRLATWILPPHRKGWAEAMLNELAYAASRRAALSWVPGCVLFAIGERTSCEPRRTFMTRRILKLRKSPRGHAIRRTL